MPLRRRGRFADGGAPPPASPGSSAAAAAVDAAPLLIWTTSPTGEWTWFNRMWLDFRGLTLEEELHSNWRTDAVHPVDVDECEEEHRLAFANKEPFVVEYRLARHDGAYRWMLERGEPRYSEDGAFLGFLGSCMDVTDRRERHDDLEQRFRERTAVANLGRAALGGQAFSELIDRAVHLVAEARGADYAAVLELQPDGDLLLTAAVGFPVESIGRERVAPEPRSLSSTTLEDGEPRLVADWTDEPRFTATPLILAHGVRSSCAVAIRTPEGRIGILGIHSRRINAFHEDDLAFVRTVANIIGSAYSRQSIDVALRESESRLQLALEAGEMGMWEWNPETGETSWSANLFEFFGVSATNEQPTFDAFLSFVHPEDREHVVKSIHHAVEHGSPIRMEYRIVRDDGAARWIEARGSRSTSAPTWVGVAMDVNERKILEIQRERLLEFEQEARLDLEGNLAQLDALLEHSPVAFAFFDTEGRFGRVNARFAAMDGLPVDSHVGHTLREFMPDLADQLEPCFQEVRETDASVSAELTARTPETPWADRYFLAGCYPLHTPDGNLLGFGAALIDITDRKLGERTISLTARATELLAGSRDVDTTMSEAVDIAVPEIADACHLLVFATPTNDDKIAIAHRDQRMQLRLREAEERWPFHRRLLEEAQGPMEVHRAHVLREFTDARRHEIAQSPEHLEILEEYGVTSSIIAPLRVRGKTLGALVLNLTRTSGREFRPSDVDLAEELSGRIALAIDNAQLAAEAHRSQERLRLLASVGALITVELTVQARMNRTLELVVPEFADVCTMHLVDDDRLRLEHFVSADPIVQAQFDPGAERPTISLDEATPQTSAHTRRTTVVVEDTQLLSGEVRVPGHPLQELHVHSLVCVPLITSDGRSLGTMTFAYTQSGRRYTADDLSLAQELARRAGASVEHASRYQQERATAESLQRSLLPQQVASVSGIETSARYVPGGESERVGGDWYDVVTLPSGGMILAIGDVAGHGLAAASSTGRLRAGLQHAAFEGGGPAEILDRLNRWLLEIPDGDMATVALAAHDPGSGRITIACAGHPPPLLIRRRGKARYLDGALGPPLGATKSARYEELTRRFGRGDVILLYTDGLIERRDEIIDTGLERLRDAALEGSMDLNSLADLLIERLIPASGPADDVAMLACRSVANTLPFDMELVGHGNDLANLRSALRSWLGASDILPAITSDIVRAAAAAAANALEYRGPSGAREIAVGAHSDGDAVIVDVRGMGHWADPTDAEGEQGLIRTFRARRRLRLVRSLMDDVHIGHGTFGTVLTMRRTTRERVRRWSR